MSMRRSQLNCRLSLVGEARRRAPWLSISFPGSGAVYATCRVAPHGSRVLLSENMESFGAAATIWGGMAYRRPVASGSDQALSMVQTRPRPPMGGAVLGQWSLAKVAEPSWLFMSDPVKVGRKRGANALRGTDRAGAMSICPSVVRHGHPPGGRPFYRSPGSPTCRGIARERLNADGGGAAAFSWRRGRLMAIDTGRHRLDGHHPEGFGLVPPVDRLGGLIRRLTSQTHASVFNFGLGERP